MTSKRILTIAAFTIACQAAMAAPPEQPASTYSLHVREARTLPGLGPAGTWLSVMIVFSDEPTRDAAYDAIVAEAALLSAKGLDADFFVNVGSLGRLMLDGDGAPVFADYDAKSRTLRRRGQLLRRFP